MQIPELQFFLKVKREMMASRIQKAFFVSLLVSATIIVRDFINCNTFVLNVLKKAGVDESFLSDWCRLQRSRVDWEGLVSSCRHKMAWKHREMSSIKRTDPKRSFISRWQLRPQG